MLKQYYVGDRVWWTDPDDDICTGPGTIVEVTDDTYILRMDDLGEVVALLLEIEPLGTKLDNEYYESDYESLETDDGYWWWEEDYVK